MKRLKLHLRGARVLVWVMCRQWGALTNFARMLRLSLYLGKEVELREALHQFYLKELAGETKEA